MFKVRIPEKKPEKSALRSRANAFTSKMKKKIVINPFDAPLRSSLLRAIWDEIAIARAKKIQKLREIRFFAEKMLLKSWAVNARILIKVRESG